MKFNAKYYFEITAKQNHPNSNMHLGTMHLNGDGVDQDIHKAIKYFEIVVKLNNSNDMANFNGIGIGANKDYQKVRKYFELESKKNKTQLAFSI